MKVLKFGGSSVGTPERIETIIEILQGRVAKGEKLAVVYSAFGGATDYLIAMSKSASTGDTTYREHFSAFKERHIDAVYELLRKEFRKKAIQQVEVKLKELEDILQGVYLIKELTPRTSDYILSFGERLSAFIIAQVMSQYGINTEFLDAREVIRTNDNFGNAKVDFPTTDRLIKEYFAKTTSIQSITGFIGSTSDGITTTLGRGGSDYTAAIFGAALNADEIEIWTDVNGVMTCDPRKVRQAFTLKSMTYAEAMEMSHFGAKVIYAPTIVPAMTKKIPLRIKNTFEPNFEGTLINNKPSSDNLPIKGISSIEKVAMLTISGSGLVGVAGTASRLFGALGKSGINIIMITQGSSEHSITFVVTPNDAKIAKTLIENEFVYELQMGLISPIEIEDDYSVIAVVGENMRYQPGIAGRIFQSLGRNGINIAAIAQGSSELNISIVIPRKDETKALNAIHEGFFLSDTKLVHLFIVGLGLIGSTLLEQIAKQSEFLKTRHGLDIRVVAIANSKKMLFDTKGLDLTNAIDFLDKNGEEMNIKAFVEIMKELNLRNSIFIDNTANKQLPDYYKTILESSISISTPNKTAAAGKYEKYKEYKTLAAKRGVGFVFETNVGAGLPIISTLNDLINSGDNILKIEAVLSGTLSYIFNNYTAGKKFSTIVKEAQEKGYTEPDPRDDLRGLDVARKLLILARESGLNLELENIEINPFLPDACETAPTIDAFYKELIRSDAYFEKTRAKIEAEGKVIRYMARLENGKASIGLDFIDNKHPFYYLSGSDNMVVFTTERYQERPLVIRGPGAGADVTAAGVFAEIIRIANFAI